MSVLPTTSTAGGVAWPVMLRYKFTSYALLARPIWRQIRKLGGWLESEALPDARQNDDPMVVFKVFPDGRITCDCPGQPEGSMALGGLDHLCGFLATIGVDRLQLSHRLESNQITDILTLLYTCRRGLTGATCSGDRSICASLQNDGVMFACTRTRIHDRTLDIDYTYCMTRFSRLVKSFEGRYRSFSDHRALFHVAPAYAVLTFVVVLSVYMIYLVGVGHLGLLIATLLGAVFLSVMVYMFFMIVGSIEYDNEEKAYRLRTAHDQLKSYSDRTRADLARAREVQRMLLPSIADMPLPGALEWASSFVPEVEVGGDYYDAVELGDGRAAILLADVCGHGMSAALVTAILKMTFRGWAHGSSTVEEFVRKANQNLCRFTPVGNFATLVIAICDSRSRELVYVNCGHWPEPIRAPADTAEPIDGLEGGRTMLLGVQEDVDIEVGQQSLRPGDKILLLTDGLVEATDIRQNMYDRWRLTKCVETHRDKPIGDLVNSIVADVDDFSRGVPVNDDRTVLAFRLLPPGEANPKDTSAEALAYADL